jgi:hypothetical protein
LWFLGTLLPLFAAIFFFLKEKEKGFPLQSGLITTFGDFKSKAQ